MDQPMFSCARCRKSYPSSQMSRSGTYCKKCNPHHSSFKQCDYCRSDFKRSISGSLCPRCQSLKSRYGDPKPCSICQLTMAFGIALVCQRCLHYRSKFGDPRQCEKCLQLCAFYKDEASRKKVDGQVLCWVCTYNYKVSKAKARSDKHQSKRSNLGDLKSHGSLSPSKRQRTEEISSRHSLNHAANVLTDGNRPSSITGSKAWIRFGKLLNDAARCIRRTRKKQLSLSLGSAYNDQMVTISQLQEEMRNLKRTLAQKDSELLAKDRVIAGLRADLGDFEAQRRERAYKSQALANEEIEKLKDTIRTLRREKADILASRNPSSKRRRVMNTDSLSPLKLSPLRLPPKSSTFASKEKSKNLPSTPKKESSTSKPPKQEEASTEATECKVAPSPSHSPHKVGSQSPHSDKVESDHGNGNGEADKQDDQLNASTSDSGEENLNS
nr:protein FAM76A [Hymenolepis microstoma]